MRFCLQWLCWGSLRYGSSLYPSRGASLPTYILLRNLYIDADSPIQCFRHRLVEPAPTPGSCRWHT